MNFSDVLKHYPEVKGVHEACLAFPEMTKDDFDALCSDVAENGLWHDIKLTDDSKLIDGRSRLWACHLGSIEPRFKRVGTDPWVVAISENIARRHMTVGQKAAFADRYRTKLDAEAKERQKGGQGGILLPETLPEAKGDSRDLAGAVVGISGKSVDDYRFIAEQMPNVAEEVASGEKSLSAGHKEAKAHEKQSSAHPGDKQKKAKAKAKVSVGTVDGKVTKIDAPKLVKFNRTNDSVDWANWTWNPVTGCDHGCSFCYAREIANSKRMASFYPNKFTPSFHEYRLAAPKNTKVPESDEDRDGRVFVCSMADLFGTWVPVKWVRKVFDACLESPEWEYLFLTKWPARYAKMPLIADAWYGASVVTQSDVKRVERAMQNFETPNAIKWISLEPMLGPIVFNDVSWCDLMVIGSQTSTVQPDGPVAAFSPEFDWIVDVVNQCREAGVPYYLKANLGIENPGMSLPKSPPRRK